MKQVIPEQSGEISCEARNSAGHKKQHATLTVKPTGEAPTFAKNLEDRLVEEGGKLHMEATLSKVNKFIGISNIYCVLEDIGCRETK